LPGESAPTGASNTMGFDKVEPAPDGGGDSGAQVASLESALWRRLSEPDSVSDMARAWLALQCQAIEGASRGLVMLAGEAPNSFEVAALWPEGSNRSAPLTAVAELALRERRGVASGDGSGRTANPQGAAHVAFPILLRSELKGVVAVALGNVRIEDVRSALRNLQWGAAWIRERLLQAHGDERERLLDRSRAALDLLSDALGREGFDASAMAVVTGLALRCNCTRVSLGIRRGNHVVVKVISHAAQFGHRMVLVSGLAAAMEEAVDQRCVTLYPPPPDQIVATSAHAELSRIQREEQVLTVPLLVADSFVGAMTFERSSDSPFEQETIELLELTTSIVGPILEEKRRNDRWLVVKLAESLHRQLVRLLGPGHLVRKLVAAAIVAAAVFLSFAQGFYKVDAEAHIEGLVQRAVAAPYDGFIKDAMVRAGDKAETGEVLATLEDRDLLLERLKWVTERQERRYEYDKALAAGQPAAINVIRSQINQASAEINLIDEELERTKLRSPISGLVVSGDLSQLIGTAVQRGQVLFEIAPLDAYRVILEVDEREVRSVEPGQKGELVVTAMPNQALPFVVDKITPIAEVRAGLNVFRVEGRLTDNPEQLRPGMEGVGKIDIGRRNLAWIWLHPLIDWGRIWSWRWVR
jgi:Barrel-sandwich domain of CusB or HlyD membrane-fusion